MSEKEDIRWQQRFSNYVQAFSKLEQAVMKVKAQLPEDGKEIYEDEFMDDIVKEGVIQRFEYTFELAWKVMKDYCEYQGIKGLGGPRDAIREALNIEILKDGKEWMNMILSRNLTSHTYNEETADKIFFAVINGYYELFRRFHLTMEEKRSGKDGVLFKDE